jgi:RES domain-containing protein
MRTLWRISDHVDLEGLGGKKFSSRWTSLGRRVVYLAESPAGALLEVLVHFNLEDEDIPKSYTLLQVSAPEANAIRSLDPKTEAEWRVDQEITRRIGDAWLASLETPLARVPSAIIPHTWNYLLNPEHPDANQVQIAEVIKERFDNRLFRFGPR